MKILALLTIFSPFASFIWLYFFSGAKQYGHEKHLKFSIFLMFVASISSSLVLYITAIINNGHVIIFPLWHWFSIGKFSVSWHIVINGLTASMFFIINVVSSLVHLYSYGYMSADKNIVRFFSYLSLFTFLMLILVSAENLVQLFLGWEGVGLCSYLLIGFWHHKDTACGAANKAFIVNRVADAALLVGLFGLYKFFGTLEISKILNGAAYLQEQKITLFTQDFQALSFITSALFIGCMGKSAQLGLHVWLPDAMEGPTPVSALIHAATMVTAGVFLIIRLSPIFAHSEFTNNFIMVVGALTAIFASLLGLVQRDIKKVIAFSTCSQLGYMFFACGAGAYVAALFHLITHAFFKALLFLAAGSIITGVHHQQDLFEIAKQKSNLRIKMPHTFYVSIIGTLAICGIFPFAGYYSKDMILEHSFVSFNAYASFAYKCGLFAAFLTAFYSLRVIYYCFVGSELDSGLTTKKLNVTESPKSMLAPLYILCFFAVFAGSVAFYYLNITNPNNFLSSSVHINSYYFEKAHKIAFHTKLLPMLLGIGGIISCFIFYHFSLQQRAANWFKPIYEILLNKFFIDEIYHFIIVKPLNKLSSLIALVVDEKIIDKFGPRAAARQAEEFSSSTKYTQTGFLGHYIIYIVLGAIIINEWLLRVNILL